MLKLLYAQFKSRSSVTFDPVLM